MIIQAGTIFYDEVENKYEIIEFIKSGGFASVYKAKQIDGNTYFAIKTINAPTTDKDEIKSIINEGKLAEKIKSKNTIAYKFFHDGIKYANLPVYIIMEYASEGDLGEFIKRKIASKNTFTNTELKLMFKQLINGMKAINQHLIHRDLKPENILIENSELKICDFGLAKIANETTRKTTFKGFGSIQYYPPEAWKFEKNTIQMDIYSLGLIFYELATLKHAYNVVNSDIQNWQNAHMFQTVTPPIDINKSVSSIINQIILKMIEKAPKDRYNSWQEIEDLLESDDLPKTNNSDLVELMIKKRTKIIQEEKTYELQKQKRKKEKEEQQKIISYQLNHEILAPLKNFFDEFNLKSSSGEIKLSSEFLRAQVVMPDGNYFHLEIKPLLYENYITKVHYDNTGKKIIRYDYKMPTLNNEPIFAWGHINSNSGKGFNLILTKKEDEIYGKWYLLINEDNGFNRQLQKRPSPFSFTFKELDKEIHLIRAVHIYNTEVKPLDFNYLKRFIVEMI